jgi:hypothetical protein
MHRKQKQHPWAKAFLIIGSVLVIAALGFGGLIYVNSGDPTDTEPVSFTGTTWVGNVNTSTFSATILENDIEILWKNEESSALYWKGTFPTPLNAHLGDMFTVTSVGNTEAMSNSLLGSQDETKVFTYENRTLNFQMTVMGVTTTVHLEKQNLGV